MTADRFVVLDDEAILAGTGLTLGNVHPPTACAGRPCTIHNPSDHPMRAWQLHWRDDRGMFERICPEHRCGHPDPDQVAYWRSIGQEAHATHGCCGCCREGER